MARGPRRATGDRGRGALVPAPAVRRGAAHARGPVPDVRRSRLVGPADVLSWALATPVVFWAGWPFFRNAARSARHGSATMDTLIALGALAAYLYSAWQVLRASGRPASEPVEAYFDTAAVIVTLILVGKTLEARARLDGRRRVARAPGSRRDRGDGARRGRRAPDPDRRASAGDAGRRAARGEDAGRRRRQGGSLVGGSIAADGGVGAGRRRPGRRCRGGFDQRRRPAAGVRDDGRCGHASSRRSCGCCKRPRARRRRCSVSPTGSPPCSFRSCWALPPRRSWAGSSWAAWRRAGDAACDRRAADRVPVRARAGDARGDHGGHRPCRGARDPVQGG